MQILKDEAWDVAVALRMRCNFIETGNIALSAQDASDSENTKIIKPLNKEQMRLLLKLSDLADKLAGFANDNLG